MCFICANYLCTAGYSDMVDSLQADVNAGSGGTSAKLDLAILKNTLLFLSEVSLI
jgi:hypothetical protein